MKNKINRIKENKEVKVEVKAKVELRIKK